jgi:hypothetical protein
MEDLNGCQIPCLPKIAEGKAHFDPQPMDKRIKRALARPWNYHVKRYLKRFITFINKLSNNERKSGTTVVQNEEKPTVVHLQAGDRVRVKSLEEIQSTLNRFKELKGCAFLEDMKQYCNTDQRVFKVLERFLDERDYQVKRAKGIVLLEGVFCQGTPVFGRCDRSCLSFWREEWLEKI